MTEKSLARQMHYVSVCDDMIHTIIFLKRARTRFELSFFQLFIRDSIMKSIVFLLAFVAMSTSLFAQQQVLGQSPRSAKIYNSNYVHLEKVEEVKTTHRVLGQSPRSAKIYNSNYVPIAQVEPARAEPTAHVVLGQSPRSARIYMAQKQHIVLGQSPRSAKIYNTRALQGIKGIVSKMAVADNVTTLE